MQKGTEGGVFLGCGIFIFIVLVLVFGGGNEDKEYARKEYSHERSEYRKTTLTPTPTVKTLRTKLDRRIDNKQNRGGYSNEMSVDDQDVDGFFYDNREDFENEEDAWDYLDDEHDEWD